MPPLTHLPALPSGPLFLAVLAVIVIVSSIPVANIACPVEPLLMAAVLSEHAHAPILALIAVTTGAAVVGDLVCYGLGRAFGRQLLNLRLVRRARGHVAGAHRRVHQRGVVATMVRQRWVPPTRGLVPVLLGAARHRSGHFVCYSTIAGAVWTSILVLGTHLGGPALAAIPAAVTIALAVQGARRLLNWRRKRRAHTAV
jgi:membrane protein DedA with SNARE-associated domain